MIILLSFILSIKTLKIKMMRKKIIVLISLLLTVALGVLIACSTNLFKGKYINISYVLPEDLPAGASEEELAKFAWKEFFALNWESSWAKDNKRTTPDKSWTIKSSAEPNLAVWETFIHKTELNPANSKRTRDLSSGKPSYPFVDSTKTNQGDSMIDLSNYWNILDEDNEIESAYLFSNKNEYQVLYMAKTNLVEYNYIKNNFPTDVLLNTAANRIYGNYNQANNNNEINLRYFKTLGNTGMCASDSLTKNGFICLPCGDEDGNEGATEIKLAFRKLDSLKDDARRFITKEVVVFLQDSVTNAIYASVDVYGLIGMHIIHKSKNYPSFIFASFEQADVRNANMQTFGIDTVLVDTTMYSTVDPHRLNPVIERVIPESIQKVNEKIRECIVALNPDSKWQYYQLIGVQANPTDYSNRNSDNNYFMANYVVESDLLLTNFHGSFTDPFNDTIQNVVAYGKSYNMGGCMGCHGQAQVKFGTDFSFIVNAGPDTVPDLLQSYQNVLDSSKNATCQNKSDTSKRQTNVFTIRRQSDKTTRKKRMPAIP
jgi:hypothetical protein